MSNEIPFASLDDLTIATIDAVIELEDGQEMRVLLKPLSSFKTVEIQNTIPLPIPPVSHPGKNGEMIYNWQDTEYLRQRDITFVRRNMLVLAHCIEQPAIPGNTPMERLEWMETKLRPVVQDQLVRLFRTITSKGEARIYSRAETFHSDGITNAESLPPDGVNAPPVANVA